MRLWILSFALSANLIQAQDRPKLSDAEAARHHATDYLSQGQGGHTWTPSAMDFVAGYRAGFVVAKDGSGTHLTVQSAIDAVPSRNLSPDRHFIHVKPGTYRELVCVKDKAPIALYGNAADVAATVIIEGNYNMRPRPSGAAGTSPCHSDIGHLTYGTPGSASMSILSNDFKLGHLTVENDAMAGIKDGVGYPSGVSESGGAQAVALMTQGDRVHLENVRLLGHQDTFYVRRPPATDPQGAAARVYVHGSLIAGDVDFIFGNATLVIDTSTILSRAGRRSPGQGGHVLAPSTPSQVRLGFLVVGSRFIAEEGLSPETVSLGRAWDEGVPRGEWKPGSSPNGQALIRNSVLGPHVRAWAASTSRRPFSADGARANRMAEYANTTIEAGGIPKP